MSLKTLFESAVREMQARDIAFAVAGGFAADLYRREPRLTMDVDFVILTAEDAVALASSVLESVGLQVGIVRQADWDGGPLFAIKQKATPPRMVVGRKPEAADREGVDILLPEIPWACEAVERAQDNLVDFGFGPVPALTVEDVILSKLYALQATNLRAKDLDDLQSIFATEPSLNTPYLAGQISRLNISVPAKAKPLLPETLLGITRDMERSRRAQEKA